VPGLAVLAAGVDLVREVGKQRERKRSAKAIVSAWSRGGLASAVAIRSS
jgi:hypothetical protein